MFTQLDSAIPLHMLGKGDGYAIGLIDCGQEHNLIWVTALSANGEVWCAPNPTFAWAATGRWDALKIRW